MDKRYAAILCALAVLALAADDNKKAFTPLADETVLIKVKASARSYVGRPFIMRGVLDISDYYNYGYENAGSTHAAYKFTPVDKDGRREIERANVYLQRIYSGPLSEKLVEASQKKSKRLMRIKCTILPERFASSEEFGWQFLELVDWQLYDKEKDDWAPWASEQFKAVMSEGRSKRTKNGTPPQPAKAVEPSARAASLLKMAQNLEKSKKTTAALGYYRQIAKDFPETPQAKEALEQIKKLDPKEKSKPASG